MVTTQTVKQQGKRSILQMISRQQMSIGLQEQEIVNTTYKATHDPGSLDLSEVSLLQHIIGNQAVGKALQLKCSTCGKEDAEIQRLPNQPRLGTYVMLGKNKKQQATPTFQQQVFIVRDTKIGLGRGAHVVDDLSQFKSRIMTLQNPGKWSLVLAIHGSERRLGAQAPPDWQKNAIFYDAQAIEKLFSSDREWIAWRDQFGPNHLVLYSCQVAADFEKTLIANLTRHAAGSGNQLPGTMQPAQGLGGRCVPKIHADHLTWNNKRIRTRNQYYRLSADAQQSLFKKIQDLNREFGYYGIPPVPDNQILNYLFDEYPKAEWVKVTVGLKHKDNEVRDSTNPYWDNDKTEDTSIPFWKRASVPKFWKICDAHSLNSIERKPTVPSCLDC